MRFELAIAAKYLLPKVRQLSTSIIALVSLIVISLVVWLVLVFLSVTDGLEKNWVDKLVSTCAPLRLVPTDEYYQSYYYNVDSISAASSYRTKTLAEKLKSETDPYDPLLDVEVPDNWVLAVRKEDGSLQDIVKETMSAIKITPQVVVEPYELALGQVNISLVRGVDPALTGGFVTQMTYLFPLPEESIYFAKTILKATSADFNNLFLTCHSCESQESLTHRFLEHTNVKSFVTESGWNLPLGLLPKHATFVALALFNDKQIDRLIIPHDPSSISSLLAELEDPVLGTLSINDHELFFEGEKCSCPLLVGEGLILSAAHVTHDRFHLKGHLQGVEIAGECDWSQGLAIHEAEEMANEETPLWVHEKTKHFFLPYDEILGEGVLLAKSFRDHGVRLGDRGHLSYQGATASGTQEMRVPIFVAGFYDPGITPIAGKLMVVRPELISLLHSSVRQPPSAGFQVWFEKANDAPYIKETLQKHLEESGLSHYWEIQTYLEYDFSKDLVQQLRSDKLLFSLLAIIIIVVACSNIISMLILLVNDKKREIGILQSLGASSGTIARIFGICGLILGLLSSLVGTLFAIWTLNHLQVLVDLLSALQGHSAFNAVFYGETLPSQMSLDALTMVWVATLIVSLLAGLIPALKASSLKPAEILRSE